MVQITLCDRGWMLFEAWQVAFADTDVQLKQGNILSMMADAIKGKSIGEIHDITTKFKLMMAIEEGESPVDPARPGAVLGDLEALQGVRKFPVRIKCADLPWTTLSDALSQAD